MTIHSNVQIWQEGTQYIAHAMPIDVASSGSTPEKARAALDEALRLFVHTAADQGTLDEVLDESGYVREGDVWRSPALCATEERTLALAV